MGRCGARGRRLQITDPDERAPAGRSGTLSWAVAPEGGEMSAYGDYFDFNLKPVKIDKHGPLYSREDCNKTIVGFINNNDYFYRMSKTMTTDANNAIVAVEKVTDGFNQVLEKFLKTQINFSDQTKRAAGNVRDSSEKLGQALNRIEKAANFDNLQRYVDLLERTAKAMNTLVELEANGKLEKISKAIR